jgi:hypothetical protein
MKTSATEHIGRTIKRFRSTWAELDYAQRRLLEIRTGVPMTQPPASDTSRATYRQPIRSARDTMMPSGPRT